MVVYGKPYKTMLKTILFVDNRHGHKKRTHKNDPQRTHKRTHKMTHKRIHKRTHKRIHKRIHRRTHERTHNYWFYIGFTGLSATSVVFTLVLQWLSTENLVKPNWKQHFSWTTGTGTKTPEQQQQEEEEEEQNRPGTALASQSNRLSLAHTASPRLARSHARTKWNDFPVGVTKDSPPPASNIYT